jgi:hypothetical protein
MYHVSRKRGVVVRRTTSTMTLDLGTSLLMNGLKKQEQTRRGSNGVGFILSKNATRAWKASGSKCLEASSRVAALTFARRAKVKSATVQPTVSEDVTVIAGCSPHSGHSDAVKQQHFGDLDVARGHGSTKGVVLTCMDGDASMGVACSSSVQGARGRHGEPHVNEAGCKLRDYVGSRNVHAASAHFKQKSCGAWKHVRSGLPHQIDHMFVSREHKPLVVRCKNKVRFLRSGHSAVSPHVRCVPFVGKKAPERDERKVKGGVHHDVLRQGSRDYYFAIV